MKRFFFFLFFALRVAADELTLDPPLLWDSPCAPCNPPRCCSPSPFPGGFLTDDMTVDLSNPLYHDGVLSTEEGGVLTGPGIRIQARKVVYTRLLDATPPVMSAYCEGDLLVDYNGKTLVGESLFFDLLTNNGVLVGGRTALPPWYVGGEVAELCSNGDVIIRNGYITTSQGGERAVELHTPFILLSKDNSTLTAQNITFRINTIPLLWLPKIQLDLQQVNEYPFAVTFGWGGYPGTHLGIRYQFLKWNDLKGYARADVFFGQGIGVGIETQYCPSDSWAEWYTRNYYANDIAIFDPRRRDRYRFQGTYFNLVWEDTTTLNAVYDIVSDGEFATEYNTEDFALKTADRTELEIRRQDDSWIARLFTQVRVNSFQSVEQKLPEFAWTWHPFEIGESGIIAQNVFKAAYNYYVSSDEIPLGPNFQAGRMEVRPYFYRPFPFGPFTLTPEAGFIGIAYSNGPNKKSVGQALGDLGLRFETALAKHFNCFKHVIEPYAHYHVYTAPRSAIDHHFVFTLEDAYTTLQLVRFGVRQSLFYREGCCIGRPLWIDLWANAFFDVPTIAQTIPKGYVNLEWSPLQRLEMGIDSGWNFQEKQLDFYNIWANWTWTQNFATTVEYRHRGRFAWRKADFYNFILEASRFQEILLNSPESDRRDTLLTRLFYRLNPNWAAKFELRHGWNRLIANQTRQRSYTEYLISLDTVAFEQWRLGFTYEAREADKRFYFTLKLAPSPPGKCPF